MLLLTKKHIIFMSTLLKKILFFLLILIITEGCSQNGIKHPNISESESKKAGEEFYNKSLEVAKVSKNYDIILGYSFAMNQKEFETNTNKLISEGIIKVADTSSYPKWFYIEKFWDNIKMSIDYSNKGVFENHPIITFHSTKKCDNFSLVEAERDMLIKWAIKEYGKDYVITLTSTDPHGNNSNEKTYRYSWIKGSYTIDIVIGNCEATLTYRKTYIK